VAQAIELRVLGFAAAGAGAGNADADAAEAERVLAVGRVSLAEAAQRGETCPSAFVLFLAGQ
jgi:hypothetical protein